MHTELLNKWEYGPSDSALKYLHIIIIINCFVLL